MPIDNETLSFYRDLDSKKFWDGKTILARHSAKLIVSQLNFKSDNDRLVKAFKRIETRNKLRELLYRVAYWNSYIGMTLIKISKNKDGDIDFDLAVPFWNNKVASIQQTKTMVKIGVVYVKDDKSYTIEEYWDNEKVQRKVLLGGIEILQLDGFFQDTGLKIEMVEYHNYGFIPVFPIYNEALRAEDFNNTQSNLGILQTGLTDDYAVANIPQVVNMLIKVNLKEAIVGQTKVFGEFNPQELKKLAYQNGSIEGELLSQFFWKAEMSGGTGSPKNNVNFLQNSPQFKSFTDAIQYYKDFYFENSGYSTPTTQVAGDTATGVIYSSRRDIETTERKRESLTRSLMEIFDGVLILLGMGGEINPIERDYSVSFSNNLIISEKDNLDLIKQRLEMELITRPEAIAKDRKIELQEAEEIAMNILDENMALQDLQQAQIQLQTIKGQPQQQMEGPKSNE